MKDFTLSSLLPKQEIPACIEVTSSLHKNSEGSPRHFHECHEFMFCLEGELFQYEQNNTSSLQRKNDLYFFPAETLHNSWSKNQRSNSMVIWFSKEIFEKEFKPLLQNHEKMNVLTKSESFLWPLSQHAKKQIREEFLRIQLELKLKQMGHKLMFLNALRNIFIILARDLSHSDKPLNQQQDPKEIINDILHYMTIYYESPISIDSILDQYPLSRSHFHALFKKHTGMTFSNTLNHIRLEQSKKLLQQTEMPITEIALNCGFNDSAYFTNCFKKYTNSSPRSWRKQAVS